MLYIAYASCEHIKNHAKQTKVNHRHVQADPWLAGSRRRRSHTLTVRPARAPQRATAAQGAAAVAPRPLARRTLPHRPHSYIGWQPATTGPTAPQRSLRSTTGRPRAFRLTARLVAVAVLAARAAAHFALAATMAPGAAAQTAAATTCCCCRGTRRSRARTAGAAAAAAASAAATTFCCCRGIRRSRPRTAGAVAAAAGSHLHHNALGPSRGCSDTAGAHPRI
eukprot:364971-Chlamydomonas_euryale.AAC.2